MGKKMRLGVVFSMVLFLLLLLLGCSSSSSGNGDETPENGVEASQITGTLAKGPVQGATVNVYKIGNGLKGDRIGGGTTNANGLYSIDLELDGYDGPLYIEATGGTYTDEATGNQKTLATTLRAALPEATGNNITACISPLTELAVRKAGARLYAHNIEASNKMISQFLGTGGDILTDHPFDPTSENAGAAATEAEKVYTMILAAISVTANEENMDTSQLLEYLENDLKNNILDETGDRLKKAIVDFASNPNHRAGINAAAAIQQVETIRRDGLEPVGELQDVQKALIDFLWEPTEDNFQILNALLMLTPQTPESHLYAALGELTDIYHSDAALFFRDELGIDFDADWGEAFEEELMAKLLAMPNYDDEILDAAGEINLRLGRVKEDLNQAEGAYISISLTGFDTVYLDDIDVKLLKAFTNLAIAACSYIESINFTVDEWHVGGVDVRVIIEEDEEITDEQIDIFLENNSELLRYADQSKLVQFRNAVDDAAATFDDAVSLLASMPVEERDRRMQHAFYLPGDFALTIAQVLNEETVDSILDAMNDHTANIRLLHEDEIDHRIVVEDDGFAYRQSTFDLYLITLMLNPEFSDYSLYHIANGFKSPRDLIDKALSIDESEEVELFLEEGEPELYASGLTEIEFDHPIKTYTIAQAQGITIDGSDAGWDEIEPLFQNEHATVKLARNAGNLLLLMKTGSLNSLHFRLSVHPPDKGHEGQSLVLDYWPDNWRARYEIDDENFDLDASEYAVLANTNGVEARFPAQVLDILSRQGHINNYTHHSEKENHPRIQDWQEIKLLPETVP